MTVLVRVLQDPYERLILCHDHLRQIAQGAIFAHEELPAAQVTYWGHRCIMCGVESAPDRLCAHDTCRRPLHPQWPAVYCCNLCALEDA